MSYRILIFSRNDLKMIIVGTVIGGILQVICWKYLKGHPELLNNQNSEEVEPVIETKKPGLRRFLPRGGAILGITGAKLVAVISYLAENGAIAGLLLSCTGVIVKKIPATAISTYLCDAFPQNLPELEKKKFILVKGKKIYLDQCDQNFKYLFKVLSDQNIPFTEKKELTYSILMNHLDLKTLNGRIRFILCIITILYVFSMNDVSNYFIMMQNLIRAVKEGRISKQLARLIIRKLKKKGLPVDPQLIVAAS